MPVRNHGFAYRSTVDREDAGRTAVAFLVDYFSHTGPEGWEARFAAGEIAVAGERIPATRILRAGEVIVWHRPPWDEPDVPLGYDVLHQDAHVVVVDKPSGVPTVPSGGFLVNTLLTQVRRQFPTASPMHRLGTGTSGVVVFALDARTRSLLQADWRAGRVEKTYLALVEGEPPEGRIDVPIGPVPHPRLGTVHAASPQGRRSTSHVRIVERLGGQTCVEVRIETGRPHQIRIHMAAIGHPLVGDPLFLPGGAPDPDALATDVGYTLHAWRVAFDHPAAIGPRTVVIAPLRPGGSLRAP